MNIIGKIWGTTCPIIQNPVVELHKLQIKKGYRCSTHRHSFKSNGFYVERGKLSIHVKKNDYNLTDVTTLTNGMFTIVKPGEYHWFEALEDTDCLELYWPELLSEDIVRETVGGNIQK